MDARTHTDEFKKRRVYVTLPRVGTLPETEREQHRQMVAWLWALKETDEYAWRWIWKQSGNLSGYYLFEDANHAFEFKLLFG